MVARNRKEVLAAMENVPIIKKQKLKENLKEGGLKESTGTDGLLFPRDFANLSTGNLSKSTNKELRKLKISKLKKLCKHDGQIIKTEIVCDEGILKGKAERAFLGTFSAKYRLSSFYAGFEPEDFADLWEISSKTQERMFFDSEVGNLDDEESAIFKDFFEGEICIAPRAFSFALFGAEWKVFLSERGKFVFVPAAELAPIDIEDEELNFWLRGNYIAIKKGLYLLGIVEISMIEAAPVLETALYRLCEIAKSVQKEGAGTDGE